MAQSECGSTAARRPCMCLDAVSVGEALSSSRSPVRAYMREHVFSVPAAELRNKNLGSPHDSRAGEEREKSIALTHDPNVALRASPDAQSSHIPLRPRRSNTSRVSGTRESLSEQLLAATRRASCSLPRGLDFFTCPLVLCEKKWPSCRIFSTDVSRFEFKIRLSRSRGFKVVCHRPIAA